MHFIDPLSPPAGKQTPPFTAQSSKALCRVTSRDLREVGEAAAGHRAPCRSAPGPSPPTIILGETEAELEFSGCSNQAGFHCTAEKGKLYPAPSLPRAWYNGFAPRLPLLTTSPRGLHPPPCTHPRGARGNRTDVTRLGRAGDGRATAATWWHRLNGTTGPCPGTAGGTRPPARSEARASQAGLPPSQALLRNKVRPASGTRPSLGSRAGLSPQKDLAQAIGGCSCSILNHSCAPLNRAGRAAPGEGRKATPRGGKATADSPSWETEHTSQSKAPAKAKVKGEPNLCSPWLLGRGHQGDTPDTSMAEQKQENRNGTAAEGNVWQRRWFTMPQHPSTLPREAREKPRQSTETPHPPQRGHTGWPRSPPAHHGNAQGALEQDGKLQQTLLLVLCCTYSYSRERRPGPPSASTPAAAVRMTLEPRHSAGMKELAGECSVVWRRETPG